MKLDCQTNTYKAKNEDSYGHTKGSFWVCDGASSLSKKNVMPDDNDVAYIVSWWNSYLADHLDNLDKTIQQILVTGVRALNDELAQFADVTALSKLDRTSLGIAIARINKDKLECFVLGDVEVNLLNTDSTVESITDRSIQELDQQVISLMANNSQRQNEIVFKGFTKVELELLRVNRMKMNTPGGYYILEHDEQAIEKGIYQEYYLNNIDSVLLMTDGFAMLRKKYSKIALFKELQQRGVKSLLAELRKLEDSDLEMKKYQRLKKHDDATAIFIQF